MACEAALSGVLGGKSIQERNPPPTGNAAGAAVPKFFASTPAASRGTPMQIVLQSAVDSVTSPTDGL
jgi:hypothetical protein